MNSSFRDGVQFAWDATSIELAQTCLRKYYYTMVLGIQPNETSVHLVFGGHYAKALETFYKLRAKGKTIDDALAEVIHMTMINTWEHTLDEQGNRVVGTGQPVALNHSAKTRIGLIRSLVWYVDQFGEESDSGIVTYHLADGTPAVELSFTFEPIEGLLFCGHLDRVVTYGDHLYFMDQKTTGSVISPKFFADFSPNNQMSMYTWAGTAVLGSPLKGGIVDAAQIGTSFTRFERGWISRTQDQLDEWFDSTLETIDRTQQACRKEKFPMNLSACGNYGGCPFRELCSRTPSLRESYIRGGFKPKKWDPLERR